VRRRRSRRHGLALPVHLSASAAGAVLSGIGLVLALAAQVYAERNTGFWFDATLLFGLAAIVWWLALQRQSVAPDDPTPRVDGPPVVGRRRAALIAGISAVVLTAIVAPLLLRIGPSPLRTVAQWFAILRYPDGPEHPTNNLMPIGVLLWLSGVALYLWSLGERVPWSRWWRRLWHNDALHIRLSAPVLALLAIMALAVALRFYDLPNLPLEMTSDHTEKLLDVADIMAGARPVYLPRNAGREPLEFYWIALLIASGMPLGFLTLKFGMSIVSVLSVPVVYWLGKRVASVEVGLLSALVLALSPWHLQITRIGLRIAFSPLFAALTLALLYLALQTGRRNAWLALGVSLGTGMYGYSGFRPMAFLVGIGIALKLLWDLRVARGAKAVADPAGGSPGLEVAGDEPHGDVVRQQAAGLWQGLDIGPLGGHLAAAIGASLIVAAPLIRFALDQPETFWGRTLTRATGAEVALGRSPWVQLAINWRQALLMFNLTSDRAWFESPPGRPALETVTAALFVLGAVTALHYLTRRRWREPLLLVAVPTMLVASVLALAFPDEVPHLSRAAGALPAAVVLCALPLTVLGSRWRAALGQAGSLVLLVVVCGLFAWSAHNTVHRYFVEYRDSYNHSTHPTNEGAAIARGFLGLGGDLDHVFIVGWPHGWDYRALGAQLGDLRWNGLLWGSGPDGADSVELAAAYVDDPAPQLYFVGGEQARATVGRLRELFPQALATEHESAPTGKSFWTVFVPGRSEEDDGG
jgi:hypothetical protein